MHRPTAAVLSLALVSSSVAVPAQAGGGQASGPGIVWQQDFAAARELAAQSGKPLFVTFRCER